MEMLNKSGISPSFDKIVIAPVKVERTTKGGIVLPDQTYQSESDAAVIGRLVAAGAEALDQLAVDGIGVGDQVLYSRYSCQKFPVHGVMYFIGRWQNVLGKAEHLPDFMLSGAEDPLTTLNANDGLKVA